MTSFLWVWYMFCFLWSLYWLLLPFFWKLQWSMPLVVGTLAEKRVLSSFMGVQEKQMKQCNICQILSSELLLSDIYSCTCLMLILFCLDWPFLRERGKKPWSPLKSDIFVQQPEVISVDIYMYDSLLLHQDWVFNTNCLCSSQVTFWTKPSATSYSFWRYLDALC